jgi:hypothetical protein
MIFVGFCLSKIDDKNRSISMHFPIPIGNKF